MSISRFPYLKGSLMLLVLMGLLLFPISSAFAQSVQPAKPAPNPKKTQPYQFVSPIFGLATAHNGSLLVADAGAGVVEYRKGKGTLFTALPGVTDVAPFVSKRGSMFALTSGGDAETSAKLFRIDKGKLSQVADLLAFEAAVNPAGGEVDSNPFDVAALAGDTALVADAGGNDLLVVDSKGNVDWVAIFPAELAPTEHAKSLVGCPEPAPGFEFVCGLPEMIPAEPVATSIAIGPDGAYYVGELKGFPAPLGMSRIWRIEPGTLHADCATSPACSVVANGFTSIVDLAFSPNGTLYVVEMDEASWAAVEFGLGSVGGTVNACDSTTWECTERASGLTIPMAVTVDRKGKLFAAVFALIPGAAQVIELP